MLTSCIPISACAVASHAGHQPVRFGACGPGLGSPPADDHKCVAAAERNRSHTFTRVMCAAPTPLVLKASLERRRAFAVCVHGAPEALQESLIEEWSDCTAECAYEKLSGDDVAVTNASDKEAVLPKILELGGRVSEAATRLGVVHSPAKQQQDPLTQGQGCLHLSSSMPHEEPKCGRSQSY